MRFTSMVEKLSHYSGLYRKSLALEADPNGADRLSLWATMILHRPGGVENSTVTSSKPVITRTKVIDGVASIAFAYFGQADEEESARWHANWSSRLRLPQLVSIQLRTASPLATPPPQLCFAIRIGSQ